MQYAAFDCSAVFDGSSTFSRNVATYGGAIAVDKGKCTLSGNSSFVQNSGISGVAIFIHGNQLVLIGEHMFTSNVAKFVGYGGAIHALRTTVMLSGNQYFTNNSAMYGGGMAVSNYDQKGLIQFTNTSTYFQRNYAHRHGAAIFIEDPPSIYCNSGSMSSVANQIELCFFQMEPTSCNPHENSHSDYLKRRVQEHNAHMIFEYNFAEESGHILYGGTLDRCGVCIFFFFWHSNEWC